MVSGCTRDAGKSWITTALCRCYARPGLVVRPLEAQNTSNHARVVALADGAAGEIGSAQYVQALAARARPELRMNRVLLKPEATPLDAVFDRLAATVNPHVTPGALMALLKAS